MRVLSLHCGFSVCSAREFLQGILENGVSWNKEGKKNLFFKAGYRNLWRAQRKLVFHQTKGTEWRLQCTWRAKCNTPWLLSLKELSCNETTDCSWCWVGGLAWTTWRNLELLVMEIGEKKMARHHPIIWMKPLPLSWLLLMTPMNFGLFWQLDFEMLDRSPGPDKQPASSEKASADRRKGSLPRPRQRPKGQEDAIKATNDCQFKGRNRKHMHFPGNMNFLLGIILKTLWLAVNGNTRD